MQVTLVYNPGAGLERHPDPRKLRKLIEAAGHKVRLQSSKESGWTAALKKKTDLVAVAAGDGTVGRVARRMAGRGVPVALLPMGTANNIARSLGVADLPVEEHIRAWKDAPRVAFDAATATGPWGSRRIVEGLGIGLFAWTMPQAKDSKALARIESPKKALAHVVGMLRDRVEHYKARDLTVTLDGRDLSGSYVLLEAMNLQFIGPNLLLAPGVKPGDGLLHVVTAGEGERERLSRYLGRWSMKRATTVDLPTYAGRKLRISRGDYEAHVDDRLWPEPGGKSNGRGGVRGAITVSVEPAALEFVVPAAR
jgi:diacylglycerol kinase (ATP)